MTQLALDIDELHRALSGELAAQIAAAVREGREVTLDVATPALASQSSNLCMADDWYNALFIGELAAPACASIRWSAVPSSVGTVLAVRFHLNPLNPELLAERLSWYAQGMRLIEYGAEADWRPTHAGAIDLENEYQEYKHRIGDEVRAFDDLAAHYVAEFAVGLSEQFSGEELEEVYADLRVSYRRWWRPELEYRGDL